jgi:bifunctional NMN adenylyltransferase/nudix hydrolase
MTYEVKPFDTVVYIGRFQPFHNAHAKTILEAAAAGKQVIIIIGSANEPRTFKNPFTYEERSQMIGKWVGDESGLSDVKINVVPLENSAYNDQAWATEVQKIVEKYSVGEDIALIGHRKDGTSYYLEMFPQWEFINTKFDEKLDATQIRDMYFRGDVNMHWFDGVVPKSVFKFLNEFKHGFGIQNKTLPDQIDYNQIVRERYFIETYKKQYETLPYPPIFVTVDAVVIQSGHVLLVKRRSEPGKGLWAFPGGFVNANSDKSIKDAVIRELMEETKIKLPEMVVRRNIKDCHVFDKIDRSARGRTITHAFKIVFDDGEWNLPKVKGSDDAEKAVWMPISKVKRSECFEDHYDILMYFLGR